MRPTRWTKPESLLVLDLYFAKPRGLKSGYTSEVKALAAILNRTPKAIRRRMMRFHTWYPPLPFARDSHSDNEDTDEVWNDYFAYPRRVRKEAKQVRNELQFHILALQLYFRLIINTMNEHVPEIRELAKLTKHSVAQVIVVLHSYAQYDPFIREKPQTQLSGYSKLVWRNFADIPEQLENLATQLREQYVNRPVRKKSQD